MKKILLTILSLFSFLSLAACNNQNNNTTTSIIPSTNEEEKDENVYLNDTVNEKVKFTGFYSSNLEYNYEYRDDYFDDSAEDNYIDLAKVSLLKALSCTVADDTNLTKAADYIVDFHTKCNYKDIYISDDYKIKTTKDTIGFVFASKYIMSNNKKTLLISITARGFKYDREWASNFTIGKEGNHAGFEAASSKIMNSLNTYLEKYNKDLNRGIELKFWISGYSRGGAVADLVSAKIRDNNIAKAENIYAYTFEAPASMLENDKEYNFIKNYINKNDIVPKIIPNTTGLIRPGVDFDYNVDKDINKVKENLAKISADFKYAEATKIEAMDTFIADLIEKAFSVFENVREEYTDNYQDSLVYFLDFMFSLDNEKFSKLTSTFKGMSIFELASVFSKDGFLKLLKTTFEKCEIEYDNEKITKFVDDIHPLVFEKIIGKVGYQNLILVYQNISAIAQCHMQEMTLAIIMS